MGYRSQVTLVAAFKNKKQMDEVLAVYVMNENVQKHSLMEDWQVTEARGHPVLYYETDYTKWYEDYEDVRGYEAMGELMTEFFEQREFPYLWHKVRIGEEMGDIEAVFDCEDDADTSFSEIVYENVEMVCTVALHFKEK